MAKINVITAALAAILLSSCATSMPRLPEMPSMALPAIPGLSPGPVAGDPACAGGWRLENGGGIAVTATENGLRWRSLEGETGRFVFEEEAWQAYSGWTDIPETRQIDFSCETGLQVYEGAAAIPVETVAQETVFAGAKGTQFAGRLILPA